MSAFDGLVGQSQAVGLLDRMLATERVPQALVFHGPEGVGKATAARMFTGALLCEEPSAGSCGRCAACRQVLHDGHADFLTVRRLPKKEGAASGELFTVIKVEQIREVARLAGLAPRGGKRRVFLIDPADRMNSESQNALLKTLEEPPGRAVLILVASRAHLLLPTVRSRCFSVPFSPLRAADLAAWLERRGMSAEEAGARAALATGRPGVALQLDVEALSERREELVTALEALCAAPPPLVDLPARAADVAGKDESTLLDSLELIEGLIRDAARSVAGSDVALVHADLASRLARLGERLGADRAAALVESIERMRGYLRFNTNRVLIAESLLAAVAGGPIP